jgi:hypothetical protein
MQQQIFREAGRTMAEKLRTGDRSFLRQDTFDTRGLILHLKDARDTPELLRISTESSNHPFIRDMATRALGMLNETRPPQAFAERGQVEGPAGVPAAA